MKTDVEIIEDLERIGSLVNIQGLNGEEDRSPLLNDRGSRVCVGLCVSSVVKNSHRPIPLSFKNDIRSTALESVPLGRS